MSSARQILMSKVGFESAITNSGISPDFAEALFNAIVTHQPKTVLEVGMANGASTLSILSAFSSLGGDRQLISIDPYQSSDFKNVGINNVKANNLAQYHHLIEKPDFIALAELVEKKTSIEFAYVDGWHTFDYTLLDFFYIDKMLPIGGIVGFNDCGYPAVRKVLNFVKTHRKYSEIDVGLKPNFGGRNFFYALARRVLNLSINDRYFRKTEQWEPAWNFYASF